MRYLAMNSEDYEQLRFPIRISGNKNARKATHTTKVEAPMIALVNPHDLY